ncbi:putative xyloglucan endotransglucosylase/hydrolase protein 32 [Abeliophyllum distichum]|uniref:Xyloglucan endotransglucosylase/hydrolase protein 32 n=1 Tax=Abeliophyllum distichum TaxID=126358 RepID=A0ABD1RG29_9LAMI
MLDIGHLHQATTPVPSSEPQEVGSSRLNHFGPGYFGTSIKLQPGYTAGVITAFYLSNNEAHPGYHDEVDIEFLGTTFGKPYTLQTNVYIRGSGDGKIIGREMKFHLWFNPTQDFHHYAILWTPREIIFFVDDVPVRRYERKSIATFPLRPMWVYGSIWDASSWATGDGKYKVDYRYQPFFRKIHQLQSKWLFCLCTGLVSASVGLSVPFRRPYYTTIEGYAMGAKSLFDI